LHVPDTVELVLGHAPARIERLRLRIRLAEYHTLAVLAAEMEELSQGEAL
jgi:hypothetical protein